MKNVVTIVVFCLVICGCATNRPAPFEGKPALAVWDLENVGLSGGSQMDLGDLLSAKIMETLRETNQFTLIERERLHLVLQELALGSSSLADTTTQLRIGRLAGAKFMVFGAYQVLGDMMRLDLRIVEVETGRILKAADKTAAGGNISEWLTAAETAARELI